MQFFKPENYFEVREALIQAGRADLIGGCDGLIPANPPKEAIEARRRQANAAVRATTTTPSPTRRRARSRASAEPGRRSRRATGRGGSRRRSGSGTAGMQLHGRSQSIYPDSRAFAGLR